MNCRSVSVEDIPLLRKGGVAARSRRFREATLASRRRGGWFEYRLIGGLNEPPRPLHQRRLRDIFLMSRPPRLGQGGEYARFCGYSDSFTPSMTARLSHSI